MKKIMVKILGIVLVSTLFVPSISACANQEETSTCTNKEETGWKELASMPTARLGFQTAVIGDKIYVIGGENLDSMQLVSSTEVYDSSTNKWTTLAPIPVGLWGSDYFKTEVVDGKIYAIGAMESTPMESYTVPANATK